MGAVLVALGLLLGGAMIIPAVALTWVGQVQARRLRTWVHTTATVTGSFTTVGYQNHPTLGPRLTPRSTARYEYRTPTGQAYAGSGRVGLLGMTPGTSIPILVDPQDWSRSTPADPAPNGCLVAGVWVLALFGVLLALGFIFAGYIAGQAPR